MKSIFRSGRLEKNAHPSVFLFLMAPFGIMFGYVTVTIGFLLTKAGIPLEQVAPIIAVALIPNIFKFIWAPLVDTTLTVKKWYIIANIITALGIFLTGIIPLKVESLTLISVIIFFSSLVNTNIAMTTESLLAHDTPEHLKGRAGGWLQAGNLGGFGLGGGAGLWLTEHLPDTWMAGTIIALVCLLCTFGLYFLSEPTIFLKEKNYLKTLGNLNRDIWTLVKSRMGFLAIFLCFLPLGTGAASNLWSSVSNDWNASADTVALVIGVGGGILSAMGCLVGGYICDKMDRKKAYILFGMTQAIIAVAMAFSPQTEQMFILWTSMYAISSGLAYAGFSAFVLETIGKGAAATKYNVFASLSNAPIYYMIYIDEWSYGEWGAFGMLTAESIMAFLGIIAFIAIFTWVNRMRPSLAN